MTENAAKPPVVDQDTWRKELDELRRREKAATRELDAIAAQRRRLPMVEMPDYTLDRRGRAGPARRRLRGPVAADRLQPHVGGRARSGSAPAAPASPRSSPGWSSWTTTTPGSSIVTQGPIDEALAYKRQGRQQDDVVLDGEQPVRRRRRTRRPAAGSASTCSCATATRCTAPGTPTAAAPSSSATRSPSSTCCRTAARRSGRTRPRAGRSRRRTRGGWTRPISRRSTAVLAESICATATSRRSRYPCCRAPAPALDRRNLLRRGADGIGAPVGVQDRRGLGPASALGPRGRDLSGRLGRGLAGTWAGACTGGCAAGIFAGACAGGLAGT